MKEASKGDVWLVDLSGGSGHEQKGRRYAVVLRDVRKLDMAVIVPFTSSIKDENYPYTCVVLPSKENGLSEESVALIFQITALDKNGLVRKAGKLDKKDLDEIDMVLLDMLKLGKEPQQV